MKDMLFCQIILKFLFQEIEEMILSIVLKISLLSNKAVARLKLAHWYDKEDKAQFKSFSTIAQPKCIIFQ